VSEPTTIYLVRHAETVWNAEDRCQGRAGAPFTPRGEQQLVALAESLRRVKFDAAYTSTLERARRTAEAILHGRGLRAVGVPELMEIDYGAYQGQLFSDWPAGALEKWRKDPWSVAFPDGESLHGVRARTVGVVRRIASAHAGETILVSAHGHVNRLLLAELVPDTREFWSIEQPNGSASIIIVNGAAR
jgi:broad specificity phosphatase PhoE